MISFDAECMSRLAYAMLLSCLHGTITGFMLYHPSFRGPAVYLVYAYLLFIPCSLRWGKRVFDELRHIQLQVQDFSQTYRVSFSVLQMYMWYLGYQLYKIRKHQQPQTMLHKLPEEHAHMGGGGSCGELYLHFGLCSAALFNLVRKMAK